MYLTRLGLLQFRNIETAEIVPGPGFNVLWGANAQGKTNLLEAIYILGHLKSFRSHRNEELINQGSLQGRLHGEIVSCETRRTVDVAIHKNGKNVLLNGKEVRSAASFFATLRPVVFSPEEIALTKGAPAGRRALIDRAIFQTDPGYLARAQEYERCLRQRNALLRSEGNPKDLLPWTEALIRSGAHIRRTRAAYVKRLESTFQSVYGKISGEREAASIIVFDPPREDQNHEDFLKYELERCRDRETFTGQTLAGPHRDDPLFLIDGRPVRQFASQGQQRSFILAFKTAQTIDIERETGEPPVLLLDDMTSELDNARQGHFFDFLLTRKGQVFVTTTDIQPMIGAGLSDARYFRVENGTLREDQ